MRQLLAVAALAASFLAPATAQTYGPACGEDPRIVALADVALDRRGSVNVLAARRYGVDAAYLKIRYAPLPEPEATRLLTVLLADDRRRPRTIDDLAGAYLIAKRGVGAHLSAVGADWEKRLFDDGLNVSAIRAALLSPDAAGMLDRLARLDRDTRLPTETALPLRLLDIPDDEKARLASEAEARGLVGLAGGLLAGMRDPAGWEAFRARRPQDAARLLPSKHFLPMLIGGAALPRPLVAGPQAEANLAIETIHRSFRYAGEGDIIGLYFNHTGHWKEAVAAARKLSGAGEVGTLDARRQPEQGWLFVYRALVEEVGNREQVDREFAELPLGERRSTSTTPLNNARALLDWLIAVDALRDFVAGKAAAAPSAPADLSPDTKPAWEAFVRVATLLRDARPMTPADETERQIAAELLFAAGRYAYLIDVVRETTDADHAVRLAEDFARRLDRLCRAYLVEPADALLRSSPPLYRFEQAAACHSGATRSVEPGTYEHRRRGKCGSRWSWVPGSALRAAPE